MELIAKVTIQGAGDKFAVPGTASARFDTEAFGISDAEAQVLVKREFAEVPKTDAAPAAEVVLPDPVEVQVDIKAGEVDLATLVADKPAKAGKK